MLFRLELVVEPWIEKLFPAVQKHLGLSNIKTNNTIDEKVEGNTEHTIPDEKLPKVDSATSKTEAAVNSSENYTKQTMDASLSHSLPPLCTTGMMNNIYKFF